MRRMMNAASAVALLLLSGVSARAQTAAAGTVYAAPPSAAGQLKEITLSLPHLSGVTGTSGNKIPLLDGANTWSARQTLAATGGTAATSGTTTTSLLRLAPPTTNAVLDLGTMIASPYASWLQAANKTDLSSNLALLLNPNGGIVGLNTNSAGLATPLSSVANVQIGSNWTNTAPYTPIGSQYLGGLAVYGDHYGITSFTRTVGGGNALGLVSYTWANNATYQGAWSIYTETYRDTALDGATGYEMSLVNRESTVSPTTPYNTPGASVSGLAIECGNSQPIATYTTYSCGYGLLFQGNAGSGQVNNHGLTTGIVFRPGALDTTVYSPAEAISLPAAGGDNYSISFWSDATNRAWTIYGDVTAGTTGNRLIFGNASISAYTDQIYLGQNTTSPTFIHIGYGATGNRQASLYFSASTTGSTNAEVYRESGVNGNFVIKNTQGAGGLTIANAAATIMSLTNGATGVTLSGYGAGILQTTSGGVVSAAAVALTSLATQATNTVLGNATSGAAAPTALSMTSCSTAGSAVTWTTNTGFGCNTSITAAAVPASGLTGTTLAAGVVTSSITTVGTLIGGGTGAGFTVALGTSTMSGVLPAANGGAGTVSGILKADGSGTVSAASAGTDYVTGSSSNTFTNKTFDTAGTGNSFSINGVAATANTGTGSVVRASGPTLTGNVGVGGSNGGSYGIFMVSGTGYQALAIKSTDASGVVGVLAANAAIDLRFNAASDHPFTIGTANISRLTIYGSAGNGDVEAQMTTASTSTSTGALRSLGGLGVAGAGWFGTYVATGVVGVASLPTCGAGIKGARMFVNDANATTFASTVASGGSNNVPVVCDGTNWIIG